MLKPVASILTACCLVSGAAQAAGFRSISVSDAPQPPLDVGLWYPTEAPAPDTPNTEYGLAVAIDAPVGATNRALIVISHGFGGWYAGHADTAIALAEAGFIVAAPSHTGNTWSDMSSPIERWGLDRPRHISRVIDHLLSDPYFSQHIDAEKIGVYGFSAGGFTALSLIGAIPDRDTALQHCVDHPGEFACSEGLIAQLDKADVWSIPPQQWGHDDRVKAAVISAPGMGFTYTRESLDAVSAAVQLWSGELDDSVPTATNAAQLAARLPVRPETHWIDGANHFAFMIVACREAFKQADPEEYSMVCEDADGFDRRAFHHDMHQHMVRFYRHVLKTG